MRKKSILYIYNGTYKTLFCTFAYINIHKSKYCSPKTRTILSIKKNHHFDAMTC